MLFHPFRNLKINPFTLIAYIRGRQTEASELYLMLTYISGSIDFTEYIYLQHYLMDLHHTWQVGILAQYDTMSDLIILLCQCDLYFMVQ